MAFSSIFLVLFLGAFLTPAAGQDSAPGAPGATESQAPPIRVFVEEVNLQFVVTDRRNRLITDLGREDFQVREEDTVQQISAFSRETNVPLRIGLLIDTSNSIRDRFQFEQRAAADFLRSLIQPGIDKAFLGSFDSMAELVQDFTDDTDRLVQAIDSLRPGGGTSLYDAVYYGSRDRLLEEAPATSNFRRAMVVLSDGEDNQSRYSRHQALEMSQRAEVIVYTISTNIRGIRMPGDKVLEEMAEETGGRFFQPSSFNDLDDVFQEIDRELRSQYSLSYQPSNPRDGEYHEIEILIPQQKGLRVRARRGYYATQPPGLLPPEIASPAGE